MVIYGMTVVSVYLQVTCFCVISCENPDCGDNSHLWWRDGSETLFELLAPCKVNSSDNQASWRFNFAVIQILMMHYKPIQSYVGKFSSADSNCSERLVLSILAFNVIRGPQICAIINKMENISVTSQGLCGASNNRFLDCLFNRSYRLTTLETLKLRIAGPFWEESTGVHPHKGTVTRKEFSYHNVIMKRCFR